MILIYIVRTIGYGLFYHILKIVHFQVLQTMIMHGV